MWILHVSLDVTSVICIPLLIFTIIYIYTKLLNYHQYLSVSSNLWWVMFTQVLPPQMRNMVWFGLVWFWYLMVVSSVSTANWIRYMNHGMGFRLEGYKIWLLQEFFYCFQVALCSSFCLVARKIFLARSSSCRESGLLAGSVLVSASRGWGFVLGKKS